MREREAPSAAAGAIFAGYLDRWGLVPDGEPITTHASRLLPVRRGGLPAMLKMATAAEERRGAATMVWWGGEGAARVLAHEGDALLLERATGPLSLAAMARGGEDDLATRILCRAAAALHAPRGGPIPVSLVPLPEWFRALETGAAGRGGLLERAAKMARELFAAPWERDMAVLHGDIHHGNVLDFGARGWLAIDPKGLWGERSFDFVNILRNPDDDTAMQPGRFARQVALIAETAGLDRARLLQWTLAFAGLSAVWVIEDGEDPTPDLRIAALAVAELETARR
jgi:streptomycin 6-kinase